MKFCPHCEIRLKKDNSGLVCPKCGYTERNKSEISKKIISEESEEFSVLDQTEADETLPTIKIECEKCGHDEAVWWMLQTRSADEPTTQFYRCIKCNYTWRNYS